MKRKQIIAIITCIAAIALSACGNGDKPEVSSEPTISPTGVPPMATIETTIVPTADTKTEWTIREETIRMAEYVALEKSNVLIPPEMLPPELEGLVYDKAGEPLSAYPEGSVVYDADGHRGFILYDSETKLSRAVFLTDYTPHLYGVDIVEATRNFSQAPLMPAYVPEGYVFTKNILGSDTPMDYMIAEFANGADKFRVLARYLRSAGDGYQDAGGDVQILEMDGNQVWVAYPYRVVVEHKSEKTVYEIVESPPDRVNYVLGIDESLRMAMTLMVSIRDTVE